MLRVILFFMLIPFLLSAQSRWKRSKPVPQTKIELFHSTQTANLPTTETLKKGDFMYEISHRFGPISDGYNTLYGFDGPVSMRTALGYGFTDDFMMTVGRSNVLDNLELRAKYKVVQMPGKSLPIVMAVVAGAAINTEPALSLKAFDSDYMQFYGQLVINTMLADKTIGIGLVPSYVQNSYIFASRNNLSSKYTFTLGTYVQYYYNRLVSAFVEFSPVISGWQGNVFPNSAPEQRSYNSVAFGIALETGGHIFNVFITNNTRLNSAQYLVGAAKGTDKDAWRLAFGISRVL